MSNASAAGIFFGFGSARGAVARLAICGGLMLGLAFGFFKTSRAAEMDFSVPYGNDAVRFDAWIPARLPAAGGQVLLLVPGVNGAGKDMLTDEWREFAESEGLVLLAPSFRVSPQERQARKGYYYPELGSGAAIERALETLSRKTGVRAEKILIYGFSAGAHVAHRFALWKPSRVRAFVAASAAWWSLPDERVSVLPALIMCGEEDSRFLPTLEFFLQGLSLHAPWVWRSYRKVGHFPCPAMREMARTFLRHYARGEADHPRFGDMQTYEEAFDAGQIPEAVRIRLPSAEIARVWRQD